MHFLQSNKAWLAAMSLAVMSVAAPVWADDPPPFPPIGAPPPEAPPAAVDPAPAPPADDTPKLTPQQQARADALAAALNESLTGPATGVLEGRGTVQVPAGMKFANRQQSQTIVTATGNIPTGRELATILPSGMDWWLVFEYSDTGHVSDEEKDELDADAMIKSMRENQLEANKARKAQQLHELEITDWAVKPHYDAETHNLEWAPKLRVLGETAESLNYSVRLLGRTGVMEVTLICGPEDLALALPQVKAILGTFKFDEGQDYKAFRQGDRVAEYGLAALVTGGAVAVAAKSGLLGKLWKLIVVGAVAAVSGIKKLFGRKPATAAASAAPSQEPPTDEPKTDDDPPPAA